MSEIRIIGAGGAGINLVRAACAANPDVVQVISTYDTSDANIKPTDTFKTMIIANGHGSGKLRSHNAESISNWVSENKRSILSDAGVTVCVFSLAGGSGSVVGPLIIQEHLLADKAVIAVCIVDMSTQIDADNTMKSLQTLTSISQNSYLPVILVSNKCGRAEADKVILHQLSILYKMHTIMTVEHDKQDRINALRPHKVISLPGGLRAAYCTTSTSDTHAQLPAVFEKSANVYDSVTQLSSSSSKDQQSPYCVNRPSHISARLGFTGSFEDTSLLPMTLLIAPNINSWGTMISELDETLTRFKNNAQSSKSTVSINMCDVNASRGNLVL
jgi:hypothetical protein